MNRKLWENLFSLYALQGVLYLAPMLTLPYTARVLGTSEWGALAFAEAYARYVGLVIEYGFGLSATREIACVRNDGMSRAEQVAKVLSAQLLLIAATLVLTMVLVLIVPLFTTHTKLLASAYAWAICLSLNPLWYFQGIERMRLISGINIAGNLAAAGGVFIWVRGPGDGWIKLALQASACFACTAVCFGIIYRTTPFLWPSLARSWKALRQGGSLFLFRSSVSLYTTANVLLLGFLAPPAAVAWFAGAEKIARVAVGGTAPISQVFFPRINHLLAVDPPRAVKAARLSAWLMMGAGISIGLGLFFGAPLIVRVVLGPGFLQSVGVLRLLALLPPLIAASNVFGIQWMLSLRMDREFNWIIASSGFLNVAVSALLGRSYQHMGMAISVVLAETMVTAGTVIVLRRRHLDPWSAKAYERAA
jgi:PST family polysaccharide transporter